METGGFVSCSNAPEALASGRCVSIEHGLGILMDAERLYGHNIIRFDNPALRRLYPDLVPTGRMTDTLVVAQMRYAHIAHEDWDKIREGKYPSKLSNGYQMAGSQSLEAWGIRLGNHKGDYTTWCKEHGVDPWAEWRPEMQKYCEQDTEVNRDLVLKLRTASVSPESSETEHELAEYLRLQEENGWPFDMAKAAELYAKLAARRGELHLLLIEKFGSWQAKDGKPFVPKRNDAKRGYQIGVPVQKYKTVEFNPKSNAHIEKCLKEHYGWVPTSFTKSGQAEITEDTLEALAQIPEAALIHEYLTIQKRIGMLAESKKKTSWMEVSRVHPKTGIPHIHGRVKQNHAATHRASHVSPNVAQVPKVGSPYGAECRELWHVPVGWVQIGADASGLELRCLAHYMGRWDGGAYGETVLKGKQSEGTDIHTVNMRAAGLKTRDEAKTFIYAWLYGEGDEARGAKFLPKTATAAQKRRKGRAVSENFLKGLPALASLKETVVSKLTQNGGPGFMLLPDGRRVYIRQEHSALNYLLQGAGAIICKRWIVEFNRRLTAEFGRQGWDGKWAALGWIHDEVQLAVRPEIADRVCEILISSIRHMTEHFGWRCPLDGEAKIGPNWKACH